MRKKITTYIIIILTLTCSAQTWEYSNLRQKNVYINADSIKIDSLSVIPASEIIKLTESKRIVNDSLYWFNYLQSTLYVNKLLIGREVEIQYRVFNEDFSSAYYHRETPRFINTKRKEEYNAFKITSQPELYKQESIFKNGSFSRGITFGNNQDVALNSGLNFQLSGMLGNKMYVRGTVTDNSIPLQPDGYTQQIQEFDKIYIQVYDSVSEITLGDYEIHHQQNFFAVNKKAQGIMYSGNIDLNKGDIKYKPVVSGAVAKGIYHRIKFVGQEGNQGPYKLTGANNEQFIIILAGSEQVYIDGKLLNRGQNNDYVIDYNTAELTFTPNQPITKDSRIVIEFEYSERNYTRFMLFTKNEFEFSQGKFWVNYYVEQDAKNQPIQQDLSDAEKLTLAQTGDDLNNAIVSGALLDTLANPLEQVLYKQTIEINGFDTLIYYEYSTNRDSAIYRVSFSYVGLNKGEYMQEINAVNGKVFKYVGTNNGDYLAVKKVISPKKHSIIDFGGVYKINAYIDLLAQLSLSSRDLNTYSSIDDNNNMGNAFKGGATILVPFLDTVNHKLKTFFEFERISSTFLPLERFRSVEFERDWNISENAVSYNEQLFKAGIDYNRPERNHIKYSFETLSRDDYYSGYKNNILFNAKWGKNKAEFSGSSLFSDDTVNYTQFHRYIAHYERHLSWITAGVENETELNKWNNKQHDSLLLNSFSFNTARAFIANKEEAVNKYKLSVEQRLDFLPDSVGNDLNKSSDAINVKLNTSINSIRNHLINATMLYRKLNYTSSGIAPERNILGRIEHSMRLLGNGITTSTLYEISSGLEPKQEFAYLEVAKGQGIFKWDNSTDYNQNGIPELNEFEVAKFQDEANYIKILLPSSTYESVYANQFNVVFNIVPKRMTNKNNWISTIVNPFSNSVAINATQKINEGEAKDVSIPFSNAKNASNLINYNTSIRNVFSWNKTHPKYGADYIYNQNLVKVILINGLDIKQVTGNEILLRYKPINNITVLNNASVTNQLFESEFFKSRNYNITSYSNNITIAIQPGINSQVDLTYEYAQKINEDTLNSDVIPKALIHRGGINFTVSLGNKGRLEFLSDITYIEFNESENSALAYEMLNGLKKGKNYNWGVRFNRKLPNGLEINFTYQGRFNEGGKIIHTGGMEARLYF